jgi:hypothetical protein
MNLPLTERRACSHREPWRIGPRPHGGAHESQGLRGRRTRIGFVGGLMLGRRVSSWIGAGSFVILTDERPRGAKVAIECRPQLRVRVP